MTTIDDYRNPAKDLMITLVLADSETDPQIKIDLISKALMIYYIEIQGYIAALWRELCIERTLRELLAPKWNMDIDSIEQLIFELSELTGTTYTVPD